VSPPFVFVRARLPFVQELALHMVGAHRDPRPRKACYPWQSHRSEHGLVVKRASRWLRLSLLRLRRGLAHCRLDRHLRDNWRGDNVVPSFTMKYRQGSSTARNQKQARTHDGQGFSHRSREASRRETLTGGFLPVCIIRRKTNASTPSRKKVPNRKAR
jgi:hypothetical protein